MIFSAMLLSEKSTVERAYMSCGEMFYMQYYKKHFVSFNTLLLGFHEYSSELEIASSRQSC
jgi:hypothetical protein